MMPKNPKSVSYETDGRTGYVVEKTTETRPDGGQNTFSRLLIPVELVKDETKRLPGIVIDNQECVRQAALKLQAAGSTKGHLEVQEWYLRHAEEIETLVEAINTAHVKERQAEGMSGTDIAVKLELPETKVCRILQGKEKLRISDFREEPAAQTEGFHDAAPDATTRAFEATTKAIIASIERVGKHEGTDPEDQKGWTPLAKKIARRANAKMLKKSEPIEVEDEAGRLHVSEKAKKALSKQIGLPEIAGIDLEGLSRELHLDCELQAYLRCYSEVTRAEMGGLLTRETGEVWDAKRVDRVRKRFEYHLPEIKAAAPKYLIWKGTKNLVLLKTSGNPSGAYVHALLLRLLS